MLKAHHIKSIEVSLCTTSGSIDQEFALRLSDESSVEQITPAGLRRIMTDSRSPRFADVDVLRCGQIVLVRPIREFADRDVEAQQNLARQLNGLLENESPSGLIFDLGETPYFGASFTSLLLEFRRRIIDQCDGRMALTGLREDRIEMLRARRLDTMFELFDDSASAILELNR